MHNGNRCWKVVRITSRSLYQQQKSLWYPLGRMKEGAHFRSYFFGEEKVSNLLSVNITAVPVSSSRALFIIITYVFRRI